MLFPRSAPVKFGLFEFDPSSGDLRRRGLGVSLTHQAKTLLAMLLEPPVRMRTRQEIQNRLWPASTYVDFAHGINKVVHSLRQALGESSRSPRFIETVVDEGYRFLLPSVERSSAGRPAHTARAIGRLAVLPIATAPEGESPSMGKVITSLLIERLALIPGVRVIAESTLKSRNLASHDPLHVGELLGVEAVLTGELTRQDGDLVLQVELIDAVDGALLGGAHVRREDHPSHRCEEKLALEACHRIVPFLGGSSVRKPRHAVLV